MSTRIQKGIWLAIFMMSCSFTAQAAPCAWKEFEDGGVASADDVNCNFNLLDLSTDYNRTSIINIQSRIDQAEGDISNLAESTQKNRYRTVWVSKTGGDYTTLSDAVAYASSVLQSETIKEPFLIRVAPGNYFEKATVVLSNKIYVQGSGREVTTITCDDQGCLDGVILYGRSGLADLKISMNSFKNQFSRIRGIFATQDFNKDDCHPTIDNVHVEMYPADGTEAQGITLDFCDTGTVTHSKVDVYGGNSSGGANSVIGIKVGSPSERPLTISESSIAVSGAGIVSGIESSGFGPSIFRDLDIEAEVFGGFTRAAGVYLLNGELELLQSRVKARGPNLVYGFFGDGTRDSNIVSTGYIRGSYLRAENQSGAKAALHAFHVQDDAKVIVTGSRLGVSDEAGLAGWWLASADGGDGGDGSGAPYTQEVSLIKDTVLSRGQIGCGFQQPADIVQAGGIQTCFVCSNVSYEPSKAAVANSIYFTEYDNQCAATDGGWSGPLAE